MLWGDCNSERSVTKGDVLSVEVLEKFPILPFSKGAYVKNCWSPNDTDECDKILFQALSLLYGRKNEHLLHMLLNPNLPRLIAPAEAIKGSSRALSSGEQLLIRIGLDIWDGSGGIHFNELYQTLDPFNFQKILLVLNYLHSPGEGELF